jgi:hypothetical protein
LPSLVTLIADSEKQGHLIKALFAQFSLFWSDRLIELRDWLSRVSTDGH